jgi:hypothetical protein
MSTPQLLAQTTGNVTMTANLTDVLQLTVNTNAVNLNFATVADYNNGVTSAVANQLTVTSNRPYDLKVKTSGTDLVNGSNLIPVSNITAQTTGTGNGTPSVVAALSTTDQTLATSVPASMAKTISMQYSTAAANAAFLKPAGAYVTTLTYTVIANN